MSVSGSHCPLACRKATVSPVVTADFRQLRIRVGLHSVENRQCRLSPLSVSGNPEVLGHGRPKSPGEEDVQR